MERVLVVDRAAFFSGDWPAGFTAWRPDEARRWVTALEREARWVARAEAEEEPAWKQLIPYCAILAGDEVFCTQRLATQGEARLHGRSSIGIGGHVNPVDGDAGQSTTAGAVQRALIRELTEETTISAGVAATAEPVGMINDDTNPVGRVHCGLAYQIRLVHSRRARESVHVREISKMRGGFRSLVGSEPLWQDPRFESWSRWFLQALLDAKGRIKDRGPRVSELGTHE